MKKEFEANRNMLAQKDAENKHVNSGVVLEKTGKKGHLFLASDRESPNF